jgi:hypothetical protein
MQLQPELRQPLRKLPQKPLGIVSMLEAQDHIIGVADSDPIASRHFPSPNFHPT